MNFQAYVSLWASCLVGGLLFFTLHSSSKPVDYVPQCPMAKPHRPSTYLANTPVIDTILHDPEFRNQSLVKLQNAIRIKTETHDDDPITVEDDPEYWAKFDIFESYLKSTFPLFYQNTELHKVNHHGLVYIWRGTNTTLKPLLLMGHQDTSPVPESTLPLWTYPPFDAHYNGTHLFGRGSSDCKNLVIGYFEAAEELMKTGFIPRRTVIFSFGFDEEVSGVRNKNAEWLEEKFGSKSMYAICDEGGVSLTTLDGTTMAVPGTGEKGFLNLWIDLKTPGGHSSVPPDHTSLGIMADLMVQIENDPFPSYFTPQNPTYHQYVCLAENSATIDQELKKNILSSLTSSLANKRVREYMESSRWLKYYIKTSQALDVIHGGSKSNALPEFVQLTINSRVAIEETIYSALRKYLGNVKDVAQKYGLGLSYQLKNESAVEILPPTPQGDFLVHTDEFFDVAPLTPINDNHWKLFAGNIKHVYEELVWPEIYQGPDAHNPIIVSPGIAPGNTDTKYYWNLSDHIYRYRPGEYTSVETSAHGVNEWIKFDSHLQIIVFYFEYIQSVDEIDD
ncbi:hypothetical protein KL942_003431 [Ogataea angusta]|uniref:Peptidase M20 dimerisation domain-containing protein n=1 Tax=Pichia angusta TaxID=870730 RepID=A0ABQ7RWK6_PICAN|nr:hypothetical protein KL942_003431 [Ogataea angusta]KAG7849453.1 hypothetical protein KL940_003135 [Ogataea angusta]